MMKALQYLLIGMVCMPMLQGCKACQKEDDEPPPMPAAPEVAAPVPTAPAVLTTVETPQGPGDVVRPELDQRDDGVTGTAVTVSGAKAVMNVPSDWKLTKGAINQAMSPDGKSVLAISAMGSDALDSAVQKSAGVLGLVNCQWGPVQSLSVGKDRLAAQAADGKCQRAGMDFSAAYMATEGLLAVGAWDRTANRNELFGSMRSCSKISGKSGGASGLIACCRALAQNAKSAPPPQSGFMLQAAATCEAAARNNNAGAVNAALRQFGMRCK